MHVYDEACEYVLGLHEHVAAREWLRDGTTEKPRVIGNLDATESVHVVEMAIASGAESVQVVGDTKVIRGYGSADLLLFLLPQQLPMRKQLFDLERRVANETGFEPSLDEGQQYMMLRWR